MGSMRGIAFIGGESPAPALAGGFLAEAALGADGVLLAAADSGLAAAEAAGLEVSWVVGDMDSLEPGRLAAYPPEKVLVYPHAKDFTDTELALELLWERGCGKVWLIGGGGGRTDHLLAIVSLFERRRKPERWLTSGEDIRCLSAGEGAVFKGPRPVSVLPLGRGPWKLESRGLRWPLDGVRWRRGFISISNETDGSFPGGGPDDFFLRSLRGNFLVIVPLPAYS
jgi:thiamine pyrophosphokinase